MTGFRPLFRRFMHRLRCRAPWSVAALLMVLAAGGAAAAPLDAVVKIRAFVPATARTAAFLGTEREGSGVVIDSSGLILTIGYLVLEAMSAEVVDNQGNAAAAKVIAYDHATGLGLLRADPPLAVTPMALGKSAPLAARDQALIASHGGQANARKAVVVDRRPFAGAWEYLLEDAIFTTPPHSAFGGAALVGSDGKLLGIGSLFVRDALVTDRAVPGNMFVPIDLLKPILADLLETGRSRAPPRPWLGVRAREFLGRLYVERVTPGAPAALGDIGPGDLIIGVAGVPIDGLADFYRKVWALGPAGVAVPLRTLKGNTVRDVTLQSGDRYKWLRLDPSF